MLPLIILLLLATLAAALVGVSILSREADRRRALLAETGAGTRPLLVLRARAERALLRTPRGRQLQLTLIRSSIDRPVVDVLALVTGVTLLAVLVGNAIGGPVLAVIMLAASFFGWRALLRRQREQRRAAFIEQLPELARLLANATQAGLSLRTALTVAAQETQDPTRSELRQVNDEVTLGGSMESALERLAERLPSRELAVLVNVLVIQSRAGGQVVTALQSVTQSLEARRDLRREVKTLLAGSKATALAVAGLGLLIVGLVQTQVDGGLRGLLSDPIGFVVCLVSGGLFVFGLYLVRRFSTVDV
jgi:tight adherence protein B